MGNHPTMLLTTLSLLLAPLKPCSGGKVTVQTTYGPVEGEQYESYDPRYGANISYTSFDTIPFAAPPVDDLRFSPPVPPEPWDQPRNRSDLYWRVCYQVGGYISDSGEDCLYLSVHVPQTQLKGLPVMVWLTGGAFLGGGGMWYGPKLWMIHEIILVTVNYRVGPFGFLTLGTPEAPGNAGMLDQVMALEWVQDNIASFGGDPDQVTLAGESAGSFSAFYHLVSPRSRGLFNRIIGQSGVGGLAPAFHEWTPAQATRYGNEVAILLGCVDLTVETRLACLREADVFALSMVEFEDGVISQPVVDGTYSNNPFLPTYPEIAFRDGSFATEVDVLLGANLNEGFLFTQLILGLPTLLEFFIANWDMWGPILILQKKYLEIKEEDIELSAEILKHYCGDKNVSMENLGEVTDMFTDAFFWYGIDRYLDHHLDHSYGSVYQYLNTHLNDNSQMVWMPGVGGVPGVSHADELFLQFFGSSSLGSSDTLVSWHITTMWSNFIKFGDPTPPGGDFSWDPVTKEKREYLVLDEVLRMERSQEYTERMQFWRQIMP